MHKAYIFSIFMVSVLFGCANQMEKPQLYTAYNIWIHRGDMYCINYKHGLNFIPAGTPIHNLDVRNNWNNIYFKTADTNRRYYIYFNNRWHPGQTIQSYAKKMFTTKSFIELTTGLNPEEIDSIKKGVVTWGMSKQAVLVSYGYPPEHYTKGLSSNVWYYWINKIQNIRICFDENQRTQSCGHYWPSNR